MTDEHALLAAIATNPDDDTVRLAYADYLDELGDEVSSAHAEYIRIQISRERSPGEPWDSARESRLYLTYGRHWRREIPGFQFALHSRRGFPCRASATASAVLAAADNPFARIIEEVTVSLDESAAWLVLLRERLLSGLTELTVERTDGSSFHGLAARFFAECEFPRLERLNLGGLNVDDADVGWLCSATGFPRLQELDLRRNAITDLMVDPLLVAPITRRVRRLRLAGNRIGPHGAHRLSARFGPVLDG